VAVLLPDDTLEPEPLLPGESSEASLLPGVSVLRLSRVPITGFDCLGYLRSGNFIPARGLSTVPIPRRLANSSEYPGG